MYFSEQISKPIASPSHSVIVEGCRCWIIYSKNSINTDNNHNNNNCGTNRVSWRKHNVTLRFSFEFHRNLHCVKSDEYYYYILHMKNKKLCNVRRNSSTRSFIIYTHLNENGIHKPYSICGIDDKMGQQRTKWNKYNNTILYSRMYGVKCVCLCARFHLLVTFQITSPYHFTYVWV